MTKQRGTLAFVVCFFSLLCLAQKPVSVAPGISLSAPQGWTVTRDTAASYLIEHHKDAKTVDAAMSIHVEKRRDHAEAVRQLAEIGVEHPSDVRYVLIAGWPALERKANVAFQYPGEMPGEEAQERGRTPAQGEDMEREPHGKGNETSVRVTTAIAIENLVVRLQTMLLPDAPAALADEALAAGRRLTAPAAPAAQSADDLKQLQSGALRPKERTLRTHAPSATLTPIRGGRPGKPGNAGGGSVQVNGGGEIEATVSMDGQNMVADAGCAISFSTNGGSMFTASTVSNVGAPALDGDCTVAWGQSGTFYLGKLGSGAAHAPQWITLFSSTNQGANFAFVANAVDHSAPPTINVDQPHVAADRWNASASNHDRVYMVWHETFNFVSRIACSTDSGATWGAPVVAHSGNFAFPRVAVGRDGMVYVASRSGGNIVVDKFSNCDAGLTEQAGFPVNIAISDVPCPVPGLDRCNNGNTLSSPTIAVDDTDPNHVYIGWAQTSGAGQDIVITDSSNGGQTFPNPSVAVNSAVTGVRYMPWLDAWGGTAYVGWYDRRTSSAANNDRTRYYRGSVASVNGILVPGAEADLMGVDDAECSSPWNCGVRAQGDCENCSSQPQLGGRCRHTPNNNSDSFQACDFSTGPACPATESCQTSVGCPKYGDYNGLAVGGGRLLNIWASGTAPSDLPPAANHNIHDYTNVTDLPSDFFVRDWTNSATDHDGGREPSSNPYFYETSDVWNQNTNVAYGLVNDWVLGDAPIRSGSNYAFARISRRAPAASTSAPVGVTVEFLAADYGLGLPFSLIGTEMVTMNAADTTKITSGKVWSVDPTASTHLCLAVQIAAPGDPYIPPTLSGDHPGPADPLILADNNKAQRNLQETTGGGGAGGEAFAIIHNGERSTRDMMIHFNTDPKPEQLLQGGKIMIIGSQPQNVDLAKSGQIVLKRMQPGEDRWLLLRFGKVTSELGGLNIVRFTAMDNGQPTGGFSIGYRRAPLPVVARARLREDADILLRLSAITRDAELKARAEESVRLLGESPKGVEPERFRALAKGHFQAFETAIKKQMGPVDRFGLQDALKGLERALGAADDEALLIAHQVLVQRLDAHLTWRQREK